MRAYQEPNAEYPIKVRDVLRVNHALFADKPAILVKKDDTYRAYTYRRLRSDVEALGTALLARGFGGKNVLLLGENGYEWTLVLLTALSGAFVAVPFDRSRSAADVASACEYTEAYAVFHSDSCELSEALPEGTLALPFSSVPELIEEGKRLISGGDTEFFTAEGNPDAPALLLLAQTATPTPRDVLLSGRNLCASASRMVDALELCSTDCFLSVLPLHHAYAMVCGLLVPLFAGASVAFGEGLHTIVKNMNEVHPTVLAATPTIASALLRKAEKMLSASYGKLTEAEIAASNLLPAKYAQPLKKKIFESIHAAFGGSLRLLLCDSKGEHAHTLKGLRDIGILALEVYGTPECAAAITLNPADAPRYGSAGKPFDLSLVDIYNKGEDGSGEIRLRSDAVMLGYYKNEGATEEVLRRGWLYTGDLGYLDEDGYLFITGKKKNLLVRANGKQVFPEEIEALLVKQPIIEEALVVGFVNEKKRDYDLVAVIYPSRARLTELYGESYTVRDTETELENALAAVNAALPEHKRLDMFVQRATKFERTASRKLRRSGVASSVLSEYMAKKS